MLFVMKVLSGLRPAKQGASLLVADTVLCSTVLYYTALHCIELYCTVLYCRETCGSHFHQPNNAKHVTSDHLRTS